MLEVVVERLAADPGEIHAGRNYSVVSHQEALEGHIWVLRLAETGPDTATIGTVISLDGGGRATAVPAVRWRNETWGVASKSKLKLLERLTAAAIKFHRAARETDPEQEHANDPE